jgi:uncharacterized protein YciI
VPQEKLQFVYIVKPFKENFNETATKEENNTVGEHFLYLKQLLEQGILILAGPELNAESGLVIIETGSEDKARAIMENDPAVKKKVFSAKLYPYSVSLIRN